MNPWEKPATVKIEKMSPQQVRVTLKANKVWSGDSPEVALVCRKHLKVDDTIVIHAEQEADYRCWLCVAEEENSGAREVFMRAWALLDPDGLHESPLRSRAKLAFKLIDDFSEQNCIDGECVPKKVYDADIKHAADPSLIDEDDE